jgi:Positive regulator of sigma(E), RseC/MucC
MPTYEGLVTGVEVDGRAEVVIQPISSGIPGASPGVNRRVCHCATDGSTITIEALNSAGAGAGDRVLVSLETSGRAKNAAALLGIPFIGLIAGIVLAVFITHGFAFHMTGGIVAIAAFFLPGIVGGVSVFKRLSAGVQPVIDRIVKTKVEGDSIAGKNRCAGENISSICDGCSGRFP